MSAQHPSPHFHARNTLIIICCHAIFTGTNPHLESHWSLAPFQRSISTKPGEHLTFLQHIEAGIKRLRGALARPNSDYSTYSPRDRTDTGNNSNNNETHPLLLFSGGHTNPNHRHISEAASYLQAWRYVGADKGTSTATSTLSATSEPREDPESINGYMDVEEHATDSLQNILFSLCRFHQLRSHWPENIVVVTHDFKRHRMEAHRQAIRWGKGWEVVGIDPPFDGKCLHLLRCMPLYALASGFLP